MTKKEKVLQNVIQDLEAEVKSFEGVYHKDKDDLFYIDFADTSYTIYLNSIARLKDVLLRMSINNENNI